MEPTLASRPGNPSGGPFTWEDFVALADDDLRELIDGQLIEVEVPTFRHEFIVGQLVLRIGTWVESNAAGCVIPSGYKVRINQKRGVMPDLQFFRSGNLPSDEQQGLSTGRPDLAVEVMSPSSRTFDRVTKLNWYAQKGVPEYWLLDPDGHTLERYVLRDGHYFVEPYADDAVFTPDSFPGLEIRLGKLWAGPSTKSGME